MRTLKLQGRGRPGKALPHTPGRCSRPSRRRLRWPGPEAGELLTRISGIPLLEESADERWGGDPEYEAWKAKTPVLVPRPPGTRHA